MKKKYSLQESEGAEKQNRKHCPKCCHYLDGHREAHDAGNARYSLRPGTQFHRMSKGTIYQKLGFVSPCVCEAGQLVSDGYLKSASDDTVNRFRKTEKDCRNTTDAQRRNMMEFSDMISLVDKLQAEPLEMETA